MEHECVQIVTQRISSSKLLVSESEDRWIHTGPGLVLYVSFITSSEPEHASPLIDRFAKIIKGLMTAKLATVSGWKTDHSDAESVQNLVNNTDLGEPFNLVVIPQATLAGKLKPGDKYLKYHRQVDKDRGLQLYRAFLVELAKFFSSQTIDVTTNQCEIVPNRLVLSWGTYGGRQGFEMVSTGPSTHFFQY